MAAISLELQELINAFMSLPGVGKRTASRYAYAIIEGGKSSIDDLVAALENVKDTLAQCKSCHSMTSVNTDGLCTVCANEKRDNGLLCVVETPQDIQAIEVTGIYHGQYFVLNAVCDPNNEKMNELMQKNRDDILNLIQQRGIREIIIATNPTVEGDLTASYLHRSFSEKPDVKISMLARGLSNNSEIQYADPSTLSRAFAGRHIE